MRNPDQNAKAPNSGDPLLPFPFFQAPASGAPLLRRLLLISFHFPPGEAAGALRWQKLSYFARERGWALDVISLHPSGLGKIDNTRLAELPPGTRVYGVPMPKLLLERIEGLLWRCYRWFRGGKSVADQLSENGAQNRGTEHSEVVARASVASHDRFLQRLRQVVGVMRRGYFAWMDYHTRRAWAVDVTRLGLRLLGSEEYEAIITCCPPHMAHEAGRRLAEFYERRVVEKASMIVMNTMRAQNAMQAIYPSKRNQVIAVMNGYDDESSLSPQIERKFTVAYAGAVYLDRDPRLLLKAVARVVRSLNLTPSDIGLEFMGHVQSYQNTSLQSLAAAEGIADYIRVLGPGRRDAALEFLSHASVLVSLPQDSDMAIPSKIFEYMQFEAWILAIAQHGSATELLLRDTNANVVAPDDLEGMTEALTSRFRQHQQGVRPVRLSTSMSFASRRAQAALLFDALERVVRLARPGGSASGTEVA